METAVLLIQALKDLYKKYCGTLQLGRISASPSLSFGLPVSKANTILMQKDPISTFKRVEGPKTPLDLNYSVLLLPGKGRVIQGKLLGIKATAAGTVKNSHSL